MVSAILRGAMKVYSARLIIVRSSFSATVYTDLFCCEMFFFGTQGLFSRLELSRGTFIAAVPLLQPYPTQVPLL